MIGIWIEPHERTEAIAAYRNRLTAAQIEEIEDAPEGALIQLHLEVCGDPHVSSVLIVPEG